MRTVIYIVENETSPQFRYRIKNIQEALVRSKTWQIKYYTKKNIKSCIFNDASLVIIERQTAKDNTLPRLISQLHKKHIKVIFDLDDLVFDYHDLPVLYQTTRDKNYLYWIAYFFYLRRVARRVDGFLTTNDFLAKKLKVSFNKPVAIIPNSLNSAQIRASEKAIKKPFKNPKTFSLGYFSGSPTHAKDFASIESELIKFLTDHPDSTLTVVGFMQFSTSFRELLDSGRVIFEPPVDYLELQAKIAQVNVNLVPLIINDFTDSKSELKFFESAISETITIASPAYAFKRAIKDGETGFLAKPGEWYKKLEFIYQNPDITRRIAKNAKSYCLGNYYGEKLLTQIEEAYDKLSK